MGKEHRSRFLAAKVNINANIFSANMKELIPLIPDAILKKPEIKKNSWTWKFRDLKEFHDDGTRYIYGNLGKSRQEVVTVDEGDKTGIYTIPKPVASNSQFLYDSNSEILIFEETGKIGRDDFIEMFERLVFQSNINIGEIKVTLIPIKEIVYKEIMSIDLLTRIEFDFIPPNFMGKKDFKSLHQIIKDENATRMKTIFENDKGLNKEGDFIKEGIEMVSHSYGEVKASGFNYVPSRSKRKKTVKKKTGYNSKNSIHMRYIKEKDDEKRVSALKQFILDIKHLFL